MSPDSPESESGGANDLWVVYDGECPFCSNYVMLYRLREGFARIHLIDARTKHPILAEIRARHLDLDDGMVVKLSGIFFHGHEAMHVLALLGGQQTFFNRLNRLIFSRPKLARWLYPYLVRGRLIALWLLRRPLIGATVEKP